MEKRFDQAQEERESVMSELEREVQVISAKLEELQEKFSQVLIHEKRSFQWTAIKLYVVHNIDVSWQLGGTSIE